MDEMTPPPPVVSEGGTKRDFGNMLNYHKPKFKKKKHHAFSPWSAMNTKGSY